MSLTWEDQGNGVSVAKVAGGWLVSGGSAILDPNHLLFPSPVTPVPAPTPSPSPAVLQPDEIEYMAFDPVDGTWKSQPGWGSNNAMLVFKRPDIGYGKIVTVDFWRKSLYPYANKNIKIFRVWKDQRGGYPCFYLGSPGTSDGALIYFERQTPVTGVNRFYPMLPNILDGAWHHEVWTWKCPASKGAKGVMGLSVDGKKVVMMTTDGVALYDVPVLMEDAIDYGMPNVICIETDYSPNSGDSGAIPDSGYTWVRGDIKITVS